MNNYHPKNIKQIQMCDISTIKVLINVPAVSSDKIKIYFFSP